MVLQLSIALRNAGLDAYETATGTSPILKIREGAAPADCAAADTGAILATFVLPADWMAAAVNGTKAKSGVWEDLTADASGLAAHFRIYASDNITCHWQGTVSMAGGGGNMILDNTTIIVGQPITITAFSLTAGNQ